MVKNFISLPGVSNARELGGYPVGDSVIRKGVLIRSGNLVNAKPEAVLTLRETYHVQTVIDFRSKDKRKNNPNAEIPGAESIGLPVVETMDYASMLKNPLHLPKLMTKKKDKKAVLEASYEYGLLGPEMYLVFLLRNRGKKAFRSFFRILLGNDPAKGAILWHCDDGKDRAGIATMLFLSALGADRETILCDYLYTNECNAAVIEEVKKEYESFGISGDKLNAMIYASGGVFEQYMNHAIDTLIDRYRSVKGYLQAELRLTEEDFTQLKEKYLIH